MGGNRIEVYDLRPISTQNQCLFGGKCVKMNKIRRLFTFYLAVSNIFCTFAADLSIVRL